MLEKKKQRPEIITFAGAFYKLRPSSRKEKTDDLNELVTNVIEDWEWAETESERTREYLRSVSKGFLEGRYPGDRDFQSSNLVNAEKDFTAKLNDVKDDFGRQGLPGNVERLRSEHDRLFQKVALAYGNYLDTIHKELFGTRFIGAVEVSENQSDDPVRIVRVYSPDDLPTSITAYRSGEDSWNMEGVANADARKREEEYVPERTIHFIRNETSRLREVAQSAKSGTPIHELWQMMPDVLQDLAWVEGGSKYRDNVKMSKEDTTGWTKLEEEQVCFVVVPGSYVLKQIKEATTVCRPRRKDVGRKFEAFNFRVPVTVLLPVLLVLAVVVSISDRRKNDDVEQLLQRITSLEEKVANQSEREKFQEPVASNSRTSVVLSRRMAELEKVPGSAAELHKQQTSLHRDLVTGWRKLPHGHE